MNQPLTPRRPSPPPAAHQQQTQAPDPPSTTLAGGELDSLDDLVYSDRRIIESLDTEIGRTSSLQHLGHAHVRMVNHELDIDVDLYSTIWMHRDGRRLVVGTIDPYADPREGFVEVTSFGADGRQRYTSRMRGDMSSVYSEEIYEHIGRRASINSMLGSHKKRFPLDEAVGLETDRWLDHMLELTEDALKLLEF